MANVVCESKPNYEADVCINYVEDAVIDSGDYCKIEEVFFEDEYMNEASTEGFITAMNMRFPDANYVDEEILGLDGKKHTIVYNANDLTEDDIDRIEAFTSGEIFEISYNGEKTYVPMYELFERGYFPEKVEYIASLIGMKPEYASNLSYAGNYGSVGVNLYEVFAERSERLAEATDKRFANSDVKLGKKVGMER